MLLDTITNVFGGIIFIAILVVLLTRSQVDRTSDRVRAAADRLVNLRTDLVETRTRAKRKQDLAAYLQALVQRPEATWQETLDRLNADIAAAKRRLADDERQLAYLRDRKEPIDEKLRMAADHTAELRAEIERLEATIRREKDLRRLEARLPVTRVTQKRPAHIVLTRGRMFIVDGCDGGLEPVVDPQARDVDLKPLSRAFTRIILRAGGGLPVNDDLPTSARWRRLRHVAPRSEYFLYFAVLPDAYEQFLILRQIAVAAGYEYDVTPVASEDDLILSPALQLHTQ